jgi:hypothetical protein
LQYWHSSPKNFNPINFNPINFNTNNLSGAVAGKVVFLGAAKSKKSRKQRLPSPAQFFQ